MNISLRFGRSILVILLLASAGQAFSEIRLPHVLSDEAVLQRDRPIHLWGWARPGAHIAASFHNQTVAATTDAIGRWSLYLQPESAGGPYVLTLTGDGTRTLNDLLVGDVWLASGQSNMEFPLRGLGPGAPLKNQAAEIANANHSNIRLLHLKHTSSDTPMNDTTAEGTSWTLCNPETAKEFSAVAYFFGREIATQENVPIGLIDTSWGGTPADSWLSLDTLGTDPRLLPAFASRAAFANHQVEAESIVADEKREDEAAKSAGRPAPSHPWHPSDASWRPAGLYNGMIAPLTAMTVKGFLWYQGESNSSPERAPYYHTLFSALIGDWRQHFAQGDLPFLFVQISSFSSPGEDWGLIREQQRRTLNVAHTAMAVTLDVGRANNVHPPDKQTVGTRLALAARATVYGEPVPFSGPSFREATPAAQADGTIAMQVWFDHAEGLSAHGTTLTSFELAGLDHRFVPAEAQIKDHTILVQSKALPNPAYVRYGWAGVVPDSIYNAAGLPASTFTSEPTPLR